ncbi:MAG: alkane 1-monooxygenase [Rhodovulum sp.]|nr:alkane 1-monooxygenase [Rhodovulum sp.]
MDRTAAPKGPSIALFSAITLMPVGLIVLGAWAGGIWVWAALIYLTLLTFLMDQLIATVTPNAPEGAEFPGADPLSVALALGHFAVLISGIAGVSGHSALNTPERIALFFAAGLFMGQVSNANAHELIHRSRRGLFRLGMWVYISLFYGHHTSAHRLIHHRFVATPDDPNSAPLGQSYYRFAPRAWIGSFRAGLSAERARAAAWWRTPYVLYVGGAAGCLLASGLIFGVAGAVAHIALATYATAQLILSDYVQHYGLRRATVDGRPEPVDQRHSWDAPQWFTSYLMLNAPRHSDHHAHPARPYPALRLGERGSGPRLPLSLPAMATVALFPTLWRRVMDKRVARWMPDETGAE